MTLTIGIYIIHDGKLLICHPTGGHWNRNWSIPKGKMEDDETYEQTAIRETFEETNIKLNESDLSYVGTQTYRSKYKQLISYCHISDESFVLPELKCNSFVTGKYNHGLPEMDEFMWVNYTDAYNLLHESQNKLLHKLKHFITH